LCGIQSALQILDRLLRFGELLCFGGKFLLSALQIVLQRLVQTFYACCYT
jgi:hypothetical protein